MLPGKQLSPEDYVAIVRRRIWWLVVPLAAVSAASAVYAGMLPDKFRSETSILVVAQRIPESYVRSTVTTPIEDRLQAIRPQILSRTRLEQIIREFNLYEDELRRGELMQDIVDRMRATEIGIQTPRGDVFQVSYVGRDPVTVRKVADRLASLFVDENLRDRSVMAEGTSQFLEAQLADAKAMLRETELKREAYNRRYSGELPSQLNSNLAQLNAVLGQIQQFTDSLDRDRERHTFLEQQLVALETTNLPVAVVAPGDGGASVAAAAGGTAQQLAAARAQLEALATRFQPGHPDRASAERRVRDLERKYDEELRLMPAGESMRDLTPAELDRRRRMADLQGQLQALDKQMAEKQEGRQRLQLRAEDLQTRVDAVPARESELIELNRDYEVLQERYTSLLAKKSDADMSANLERRQIGEQFRVLDPARLPERPFSPNRQRIMLAGMGLGFGLGVLLVGLLEYRDTTFKTDEDISVSLGLPVVAVVPLMESAADHQRAVRRRLAVHAGLGATVFACVLVFVYALVR